jgi:hypothetical protein
MEVQASFPEVTVEDFMLGFNLLGEHNKINIVRIAENIASFDQPRYDYSSRYCHWHNNRVRGVNWGK